MTMMMSSLTASRSARLFAVIVAMIALACSARASAAEITGPTPQLAWNARVLTPVSARVAPDRAAKTVAAIQPIAPLTGGPTILLVMEQRTVDGVEWTRLLLPKRPNGVSGWVRSDFLRFHKQRMRILIDQSQRVTYVFKDGKLVYKTRNAVGKSVTPTPNGDFAIAEKAYLPANGFLGPVVMATTGFSNVLNEYAGGNGRFAMHGTSQPWVIGTRASHGCIRHKNASIIRISQLVGVGTPIHIQK